MYFYRFQVTKVRYKSELNMNDFKEQILNATDIINAGTAFQREHKTLIIDETSFTDSSFALTLTSVKPLTAPARSLSALTRYLTGKYPDLHEYMYNKQIFNFKLLEQSSSLSREDADISNEDLLKMMVDLIYTEKASPRKDEAIKQIKNIVKEFM